MHCESNYCPSCDCEPFYDPDTYEDRCSREATQYLTHTRFEPEKIAYCDGCAERMTVGIASIVASTVGLYCLLPA